ncbi:unnamed protein product [Mytilus coruscus]|uniref:Uncharacterized protein n=1 Tax=Mytilus coruscus TaxID=42192 RepID=A0A6J8ENZ6_MYTCO|nr:unnamed protein product [Mytilus coruscus]
MRESMTKDIVKSVGDMMDEKLMNKAQERRRDKWLLIEKYQKTNLGNAIHATKQEIQMGNKEPLQKDLSPLTPVREIKSVAVMSALMSGQSTSTSVLTPLVKKKNVDSRRESSCDIKIDRVRLEKRKSELKEEVRRLQNRVTTCKTETLPKSDVKKASSSVCVVDS